MSVPLKFNVGKIIIGNVFYMKKWHIRWIQSQYYWVVLTGLMTRASVAAGKISFASLTPLHERQ